MQRNVNIGRVIGRYEILEEIGHGGMAVVYRALDTKLNRHVAVKLLHPHLSSHVESRQRFRREAQAVAKLKHPALIDVYDFSDEDGEDTFIVMELVPGKTLRQTLDQITGEPLPAEIVALIIRQVSAGMARAHESGVVHRDIKPENILLTPDGEVRLSDFGIAHLVGFSQMTVTGQILGSPAYMSPEHVEQADLDSRADIFSLGSVLYEAGVGRVPFDGANPHAVLKKVIECDYLRPLSLNPRLGYHLARAIDRCLKPKPEQRYPSGDELTADLDSFIEAMGVGLPEDELPRYFANPDGWLSERLPDFVKRTLSLGLRAAKAKRYGEATDHFNRVLALEPGNERALSAVSRMRTKRRVKRALELLAVVIPTIIALAAIAWTSIGGRDESGNSMGSATEGSPSDAQRGTAEDIASEKTDAGTADIFQAGTAPSSEAPESGVRPPVRRGRAIRDIVFTPHPMAVEIVIDGKRRFHYGPRNREQKIPVGRHSISFIPNDAKRFVEKTWKVNVPPGRKPFHFRGRLRWRPARLLVRCNVAAVITIPGRATDRANEAFQVALKKGLSEKISLLISADGYIPTTKQVTIAAGELTELTVKLLKKR